MPFVSSPVAYPPTSSPRHESPRKRRKLDAPAAGSSLLDSYLAEREEARKVEEATEEQTVKSEPEIKQEASEEAAKTPTSVPSPPEDA